MSKNRITSREEESPPTPKLDFGTGNIEAIRLTCEAVGQLVESRGFKKIFGMTWAFLYLCPEPASAKNICDALSVSPALVSITLQDLLRWGVIRKISPMGQRRDYYVAEHDVWKMLKQLFQEREKPRIAKLRAKLSDALAELDAEANVRPDLRSRRTSQFQKIRVEDLRHVADVLLDLLDQVSESAKRDTASIFSYVKPYNQLAIGGKTH